jgi:hypothetical protein
LKARDRVFDGVLSGFERFLEHRDLRETTLECLLAYSHI